MSVALISGGLRLRVVFFCTRGLAGHVARIVMELSRRLFTRLLLIWILVAAHAILLRLFAAATGVESTKRSCQGQCGLVRIVPYAGQR